MPSAGPGASRRRRTATAVTTGCPCRVELAGPPDDPGQHQLPKHPVPTAARTNPTTRKLKTSISGFRVLPRTGDRGFPGARIGLTSSRSRGGGPARPQARGLVHGTLTHRSRRGKGGCD